MTPARGRLLAAASTGLLLAASRPPLDLGPLVLVALVPLLWAWRGAGPRAAAGFGFAAGVVYYGFVCSWIWYFGAVAIVPFLAVLALYWAAVGAVVAVFAGRGLRSPWLTAAVWVVGEAVLSRWPVGGFSWGELGYALHDVPVARSLAALGGVPLVSLLVVAANALVLDLLAARCHRARRPFLRPAAGCLALVSVVVPAWVGRTEPRATGQLRFALVQGNDRNRHLTAAEIDDRYLPRSHFELAARLDGRYDLVVFPESSMDADPRDDPYLETRLSGLARRLGATVVTNANVDAPGGRAYNLNLFYGPDGRLEGSYAKRHLVPYGEWVPLRSWLGWIPALDQIPVDIAPGDRPAYVEVAGHRVATVICFESAFGPQVRGLAGGGAEAIVVSTNNRSYRRSANSAQHVAISQMRAAETGRPVLHAAISGITAVIEADGDVVRATRLFERRVVTGSVETTTGRTPYVRFGDWAVALALLVVAGAVLSAALASRRDRSVDSEGSAAAAERAAGPEPLVTGRSGDA